MLVCCKKKKKKRKKNEKRTEERTDSRERERRYYMIITPLFSINPFQRFSMCFLFLVSSSCSPGIVSVQKL